MIETSILGGDAGRPWRVALSGTSNCIVAGGLALGLEADGRVGHFVNRSLGASSTTAIAGHLHDFDLTGFDLLVLDYAINEAGHLEGGRITLEASRRHVAALIDAAARVGCLTVILLLTAPRCEPVAKAAVDAMFEAEFGTLGVPILDAGIFLDGFARARRLDPAALFMDEVHLHRGLGRALGRVILNRVEAVVAAGAVAPAPRVTEASYEEISFLPAVGGIACDPSAVVRRANRFVEAEFVRLDARTRPMRPIAPVEGTVIGISYNAARSLGRVATAAGGQIFRARRTPALAGGRDLMLVNVPTEIVPGAALSEGIGLDGVGVAMMDEAPRFELHGLTLHHPERRRPLHVVPVDPAARRLEAGLSRIDHHLVFRGLPASTPGGG